MSQTQAQKFLQAYTEQTRDRMKFQGYHVKPSQYNYFEKLAKMYPDFDPFLFMEGVFRDKWFVPSKRNKSGYKEIPRPYPSMLLGKKALEAYNRIKRQGITRKLDKKSEIRKEVKDSVEHLKRCEIEMNDYKALFAAYQDGIISPYYLGKFAELTKGMFEHWLMNQMVRRKISVEDGEKIQSCIDYFKTYPHVEVSI